jgi:hypothetical protein
MRVTTKATQGLGQLSMNVTGMVAHGHAESQMVPMFTTHLIVGLVTRMPQYPPLQHYSANWKDLHSGNRVNYLNIHLQILYLRH